MYTLVSFLTALCEKQREKTKDDKDVCMFGPGWALSNQAVSWFPKFGGRSNSSD